MIFAAIYDLLNGDSDVQGVVGDRIEPQTIPQGDQLPFISVKTDANAPTPEKDGASPLDEIEVEIRCYAKTFNTVGDLAEKVRAAIDDVTTTTSGHEIDRIVFEDENNDYDLDGKIHQVIQTYTVREKL